MVQRLKRNPTTSNPSLAVNVPTPKVKVKAPDVSVDGLTVRIDGVSVMVDSKEFANAIGVMAQHIAGLGQMVANMQAEHSALLQQVAALASREMPAPVVNMPAAKGGAIKGDGYDIAFVRDPNDGELIGMSLRRASTKG